MSYDIWLEVDAGGTEPLRWGHWNYSSNCAPLWRVAGADLASFDRQPAQHCIPMLEGAVERMRREPERYQRLTPRNDWGPSLLPQLEKLLRMLQGAPRARVRVQH